MELKLLRARFPQSMMGQLFMNNKLLCIYIGENNRKGWTPIAGLPDGRYFLHKPADDKSPHGIQVTSDENRKQLRMKLGDLSQEAPEGYGKEAPLYLSWGAGRQHMTEIAKQNIDKIIAAIENGDEVHLTINSQYLG